MANVLIVDDDDALREGLAETVSPTLTTTEQQV